MSQPVIMILPEVTISLSLLSVECVAEAGMADNYGLLHFTVNGGLVEMPFTMRCNLSVVTCKLLQEEPFAHHALAVVNVHCASFARNTIAIGIELPKVCGFSGKLYGRTGLEPKEVKRSGLFTLFRRGGRQLTHQPA